MRCAFAKVLAVVSWNREPSETEYQTGIRCDSWDVVVPELVIETRSIIFQEGESVCVSYRSPIPQATPYPTDTGHSGGEFR